MKPLTLAEVNAANERVRVLPHDSVEQPYHGGIRAALRFRDRDIARRFEAAVSEKWLPAHFEAPIGLVIDRANRILAEIGDVL